jgi:hypothetical protein
MFRATLSACALLLALPTLRAADEPKSYAALVKELQGEAGKLQKEFVAAKPGAERDKIRERYTKLQLQYARRFLDLAETNPKDEAALQPLTWIVTNLARGPHASAALMPKTVDLLRYHAKSDKLAPLCAALASSPLRETEKFLLEVMEQNPSQDIKGQACYALAQTFAVRAEEAHRKKQAEVRDRLEKQAEKYFGITADKFGDVKIGRDTLGSQAKDKLYELKHLSVGKVAPEIEGEDGDGTKFKLSDHRGKVVLLDFWGNW